MLVDLLVQGGTVITMNERRDVFEQGYVAVDEGKITSVGQGATPADVRARRTIDARDKVVLPGLVNAHEHLDQPLYRGLFNDIAPSVRFRLMDRMTQAQSTERAYAAARLTLVELLKTGATTTTEAYWVNTQPGSMSGVCRAVAESRMRGLLSRTISTYRPGNPALQQEWPAVRREIEELKASWDSDRVTVTAEATLTSQRSDRDAIRAVHEFANHHGMLWTMHVQTEQVDDIYAHFDKGPIDHLADLGVLDQSLLAAHCNLLLPGEMRKMAESGMRVAHAPVAQLWAAKPVAYLMEWLAWGIRVGLGTDGALTNDSQNIFETMKFAIYAQRQKYPNPLGVGSGELALELTTIRAAEAIGMQDRIGSLEVGKMGDLTLLDANYPSLNPRTALLSNLVYSCSPEAVDTVIIGGEPVMEHKRVLVFDEREAVIAVNEAQRAMLHETGLAGENHWRRSHWLNL